MRNKEDYNAGLHIYLKRREEYKKKGKNVEKLRIKINCYRIQLKRIEIKEDKMKQIAFNIKEFMGINIKGNKKMFKEDVVARKIFYRYCLENGINSWYIRHFLKIKGKTTCSQGRMSLIKNKEQNELYKRFLKYVEDNETI